MGILSFSSSLRNARAQAIVTAIGDAATLSLYAGTRPAPGASASGSVLLGTLTLASPVGTVSGGTLTFAVITGDSAADATGVAAWARISTSLGAFVMDMDVTDMGGAGPVKMSNTTIYAGGAINAATATIVEGNA